jgi:hypothetical protein
VPFARRRPLFLVAAPGLAVLALALAGCGSVSGGGGEEAEAAPGTTVWVAPGGDDDGACTKAKPCATLGAALVAAEPGATVLLGSGKYPEQEVTASAAPDAKPIVIRPAPGARPRLGKLLLHAPALEFRDLAIDGWQSFADSGRLTMRRVRTPWFYVDGTSDVKLLGGSVGPADSVDSQIRAVDTNGAPVPTNILIDGVTFHDFTNKDDPTAHIECLQFGAAKHAVIRNSTFVRCAEHSVFVGAWGGTATISDMTFAHNRFGSVPKGFYSLRVGRDGVSDIKVRDNTAEKVMQVDPGVRGVTMERNVAPRSPWECFAGQRYVDNVWSDVTCSKTDRKVGARAIAKLAADPRRRPGA